MKATLITLGLLIITVVTFGNVKNTPTNYQPSANDLVTVAAINQAIGWNY